MFFVLTYERGSHEHNTSYKIAAQFQVNIVELVLYVITGVSVLMAMIQMKDMTFKNKRKGKLNNSNLRFKIKIFVIVQQQ